MDSTTTHNANLGADMFTNPTTVQLHARMHGFYGNPHCKPWHLHTYKPYSCSIARENAWILDSPNLTNPTVSCSIARKMHGFSTAQALQTLQLFNYTWKCRDSKQPRFDKPYDWFNYTRSCRHPAQSTYTDLQSTVAQNSPKQSRAAQSSPKQTK